MLTISSIFLSVVFSALVSCGLTLFLIPRLSRYTLDVPNARSSHTQATPRAGGLSFVCVSVTTSLFSLLVMQSSDSESLFLNASPLFALPLAAVGFMDDRHNLPAICRYGVQIFTAFGVLIASPLISPSLGLLPFVAFLLISITAIINFINFMDGLDGLVAGCMSVVIATAAFQLSAPMPIWVLVGALFGFLFGNWSPAKVFMGDVGSTFIGAVFAFLLFQAGSWSDCLALLFVATPLLGDACLCVLRRLIAGQRVFQAHRLHLFQRLHQAGWSHARVSLAYIAATSCLALTMLVGGLPWVLALAVVEFGFGIWLDQRIAVPFVVASKS